MQVEVMFEDEPKFLDIHVVCDPIKMCDNQLVGAEVGRRVRGG